LTSVPRWTLLRIQHATGVRRETLGALLRAAGIPVRGRARPGEDKSKAAITGGVSADSEPKPAISPSEASTGSRAARASRVHDCTLEWRLKSDTTLSNTDSSTARASQCFFSEFRRVHTDSSRRPCYSLRRLRLDRDTQSGSGDSRVPRSWSGRCLAQHHRRRCYCGASLGTVVTQARSG
jgi:hypothetical protein